MQYLEKEVSSLTTRTTHSFGNKTGASLKNSLLLRDTKLQMQ